MLTGLCVAIFVGAFVCYGVFREQKRKPVHLVVLSITALLVFTTCVTAVRHYREVRFLKTVELSDLIYVTVGERPKMTDPALLENVVAGLQTPEEFLASRSNHGDEVDFTLGIRGGTQKVLTISRAAKTRGAVVRIKGGGTVLYRELEWLIPESM